MADLDATAVVLRPLSRRVRLHVPAHSDLGKRIESSQIGTRIKSLGDKAIGRTRMSADPVALCPVKEGFIAALQAHRRYPGCRAVDGRKTRTKPVENRSVTGRQFGARIDADTKRQPLMAAEPGVERPPHGHLVSSTGCGSILLDDVSLRAAGRALRAI